MFLKEILSKYCVLFACVHVREFVCLHVLQGNYNNYVCCDSPLSTLCYPIPDGQCSLQLNIITCISLPPRLKSLLQDSERVMYANVALLVKWADFAGRDASYSMNNEYIFFCVRAFKDALNVSYYYIH